MKEFLVIAVLIISFLIMAVYWERLPPITNWVIYLGTALILIAIAFHYKYYGN